MCAAIVARLWESLGTTCWRPRTDTQGLGLLEANPDIRVLFTDIGLPGGMNGRQLAEEAKRRKPELKVLFTTGYARNAIVHDGRLDPGVELITKPFTQVALSTKLRDILDAVPGPGPDSAGRRRIAHSDARHRSIWKELDFKSTRRARPRKQ